MSFPNDENGEVLSRMARDGFDFTNPHNVEFFAVFASEDEADEVAKQYVQDHQSGDRLINIETRPAEDGGMELELVKSMMVTHKAITAFEQKLAARVSKVEGYLDGWGVLQD